ncbi:hypothetical protein L596_017264 [Steinernema carpocapsae]|uniref:Uncharacterized protein n=1 Tax=Steinernema carpocapsae TaxID=34508 RepID=A0A4U5N1U4_STECR|nr:hypothetical protein L596_017264 [Steinernema carpocapsae]
MFPVELLSLLVFLELGHSAPERPKVASAVDSTKQQLNMIELDSESEPIVVPAECSDIVCNHKETFIANYACCYEDPNTLLSSRVPREQCCRKIKFWFFPVTIASVGFTLGAVFAMCFQCR